MIQSGTVVDDPWLQVVLLDVDEKNLERGMNVSWLQSIKWQKLKLEDVGRNAFGGTLSMHKCAQLMFADVC